MSVQNSPPNPETDAEPEELIVRRLVRAIDYAEGFWLGFAKSNTPAQRRRLAALCQDLLEPLKIRVLEIELNEPITDLLPVLRERLAQQTAANAEETGQFKLVIFVHGLERSIPSREAYPPLLSALNLKRELFRQEVPHPLLLWLPDYALTALARQAPDFWAWRSGLYEFPPEREAAEQTLATISGEAMHITQSLSEQAKHERLVMLKGLLEDYRELGDGTREQGACANILNELGIIYQMLGDWADARQAHEESLVILRNLDDQNNQALTLYNLALIAQEVEELQKAQHLFGESLKIWERLGNQRGVASALLGLGRLAKEKGDVKEARRLFSESLAIKERLGDQHSVAVSLNNLAELARASGNVEEARRLHGESLTINEKLGNRRGIAITLHNLALIAQNEGDTAEAARLFHKALDSFERIGSPFAERTRRNLALLEDRKKISD